MKRIFDNTSMDATSCSADSCSYVGIMCTLVCEQLYAHEVLITSEFSGESPRNFPGESPGTLPTNEF